MSLSSGSRLGPYEIVSQLGSGGMGVVYQACDPRLKRTVAIKLLPPDLTKNETARQRFRQEAQAASALDHPNICSVFEINETDDGQLYLVMAHYEGETLKDRIERGPLGLDDAIDIATQVGAGLAEAHGAGIVHRDIKPANLLVTKTRVMKILDFGLAKLVGAEGVTQTGTAVGTVAYMSPEQALGQEVDHRTDIWSLGVVLYEMLAGQPPFRGDNLLVIADLIRTGDPVPLTGAASSVHDVVTRALAKDVARRYKDIADLLAGLQAAVAGPAISRTDSAPDRAGYSVAVLPFGNLSGTDEADFLATGLHNDLIAELSKVHGLSVISRTSVMGYRETEKPVPQIGRELKVGLIMEGTVQTAENRVRMTVRLIDAVDDANRWAERYDRELSPETIFALQSEVTQRVVSSLHSELAADQLLPPGKPQTADLEAYRLHTLGRTQLDRRTESGVRRAVAHFEQAVERDSDYALAWVGLADALALSVSYGYGESDDLLSRAQWAAGRALELEPNCAEAHASLGLFHATVQDGPACLHELERAVQIQPSYAEAHNWMCYYQQLLGRASQGLASGRRAVELNPVSAEAVSNLSLSFLAIGASTEGLAEARRAAEFSPGWTTASFYEGLALYQLRRFAEARAVLKGLTVEWAGLGTEATLALTDVAAGDEALARQVLAGIDPDVDPFAAGMVHLALGEQDIAFERLSSIERLSDWPSLAVHHFYRDVWNTVQDDPRYEQLVRQVYASWTLEPPGG